MNHYLIINHLAQAVKLVPFFISIKQNPYLFISYFPVVD